MAGILESREMLSTLSDREGISEAEWLDQIADKAEAFVGNILETISGLQVLLPEAERSELHRQRLAEVKQRIEMLDALLIECRKLSAGASRGE